MGYPVVLRTVAARVEDLAEEEFGSWEDMGRPRAGDRGCAVEGYQEDVEHAYVILTRHAAKIELRNAAEVKLILGHVLDNSINKAESNANYGELDDLRWLRWLSSIRDRIRSASAAIG